jgi:hypothetical protein
MKSEDQSGEVDMSVPFNLRSQSVATGKIVNAEKPSPTQLPTTFISAQPPAMNVPNHISFANPTSTKTKRRHRRKTANIAPPLDDDYRDCLEQAEVCREQARLAAGLKRYGAARGLFATAINLCQRALGLRAGAADEASERLRQLNIEMSTYSELAKSMERPLRSSTIVPAKLSKPARIR